MWVRSSGRLGESVSMVTTPVSSHLLVEGDVAALVDCGISACADVLIAELEQILGSSDRLQYICLTHAHFDHLGGVEKLRAWAPGVQLVAGPATANLLSDAKYVESLRVQDAACAEAFGEQEPTASWSKALEVNRVLGDGDALYLGDDVTMKMFMTPGHTADSVSYYVAEETLLAGGETLGLYRGRDSVNAIFLQSYQAYVQSLEKLSNLDIHAMILPHSGALTGEMTQRYLTDLQNEAKRFHDMVQERIKEGALLDEIYAEIHAEWETANIAPDGPFASTRDQSLREMLECIRKG